VAAAADDDDGFDSMTPSPNISAFAPDTALAVVAFFFFWIIVERQTTKNFQQRFAN
jgi:hypothetical protein